MGRTLPRYSRRPSVANVPEPEFIAVTFRIAQLLEKLGVRYAIGGSVASSVHGIVRSTGDVDIVVDLLPEHVDRFVEAVRGDFYVAEEHVTTAVAGGKSFNLIGLDPIFKVDIFVAKDKPFEISQLDRGRSLAVSADSESSARTLYVSSPEDVVLAKLQWYCKGGEVSDRQWQDVLGVLRVQGSALDRDYMQRMATRVDVADLLAQALSEAHSLGS